MPGIIMSTIAASNGMRPGQLEPLGRVRREPHLVALPRQQRLEDLAHDLLVVDDQDRCRCDSCGDPAALDVARQRPASRRSPFAEASGRAMREPRALPTALSQVIVPPCSWTMP